MVEALELSGLIEQDVVFEDRKRRGAVLFGQLLKVERGLLVLKGRDGGHVEADLADVPWVVPLDEYLAGLLGKQVVIRAQDRPLVYGWLRVMDIGEPAEWIAVSTAVRTAVPKMNLVEWEYGSLVEVEVADIVYIEATEFPLEDPSADESEEPLLDDLDGELEVEGDYFEDEDEALPEEDLEEEEVE